MIFKNRTEAGRLLAYRFDPLDYHGSFVVALSEAAIPVAFQVARWLQGPLHVLRLVGAESAPKYELGEQLEHDVTTPIRYEAVSLIDKNARVTLNGKKVVLVDDAILTGVGAVTAAAQVEDQGPARIAVGTPVGLSSTLIALREMFDEVVSVTSADSIDDPTKLYQGQSKLPEQEWENYLQIMKAIQGRRVA